MLVSGQIITQKNIYWLNRKLELIHPSTAYFAVYAAILAVETASGVVKTAVVAAITSKHECDVDTTAPVQS